MAHELEQAGAACDQTNCQFFWVSLPMSLSVVDFWWCLFKHQAQNRGQWFYRGLGFYPLVSQSWLSHRSLSPHRNIDTEQS